jgi:hypothetical protein
LAVFLLGCECRRETVWGDEEGMKLQFDFTNREVG